MAYTAETDQMPLPWWFVRTLSASHNFWGNRPEGIDVKHVQQSLRAPLTGSYDEATEQRVRGVQQAVGLPVTGVVDLRTARAIDWLSSK